MMGKGYFNFEKSQMAFIGAIFTSTLHTEQLSPYPNSSAKRVVIYSQLSACQGKIEPFEDHQRTYVSTSNKPQKQATVKHPMHISAPIPV